MIKIGSTTFTMPPGIQKVYVGDSLVWPLYERDLIVITRNNYAIGWNNNEADVEVGYRRAPLPSEYTECLYNTVGNSTLISTGWYTNATSIIEAKIYKETAPSEATYLWRTGTSSSLGNARVYFTFGVNAGYCRFGSENATVPSTQFVGSDVILRQDITGIYLNNQLHVAYTNPTVEKSTEYLRFGSSTNNNFRYYYLSYIRDGELKAYYVPCIRNSDNASGFYNMLSGTFFVAGTAGPVRY